YRFLIFFDDGYAQYTKASEIHKVVSQSDNVWEDVYPESQDFIRDYLSQYPERPMVRLQKGQGVQTEWNGRWWTAKVMEVDASLVKMYFQADKRTEWIYRGSTRLEPLFKALKTVPSHNSKFKKLAHNKKPILSFYLKMYISDLSHSKYSLANLEAHKGSSKGRRNDPNSKKPRIVYTRGEEEKGNILTIYFTQFLINIVFILVPHRCSSKCLKDVEEDPTKHRGRNPLLIPLLCSWERHVCKIKQSGKRHVIYRTPCARRLRTIEEVDRYLRLTNSNLTIDLFCLDPYLHTHTEFVPIKTFCDIKDLSYGKENVPISCVNGIDRQYPDYVEYSTVRMPAKGVKLNLDPDFLPGCDCTDGCRDSSKCACRQLSVEHTTALGEKDPTIGYKHRRLNEPIFTGIVECNVNCKCDKRCHNKVVQNGLNLRLQVFKTEKRGWGLRCLDDIPKGGFICIYAGQLLTDTGANEVNYIIEYFGIFQDGKQYGDEYLAELDFIEVVERQKEGYESDVEEPDSHIEEDIADEEDEEEEEEEEFEGTQHNSGSDSEFYFANPVAIYVVNFLADKRPNHPGTRSFFEDNQMCYIMDAKSMGNIGRYLNHSCEPNVFVQNIFVDTHDLRYPWVTFFAGMYIRAGTELTWDYNYEVGSVPDKVLYCYCGSSQCRGRLL
ncbi:hypothetical protein LOTGIDRAFT_111681, partial [Lottia gigantea]